MSFWEAINPIVLRVWDTKSITGVLVLITAVAFMLTARFFRHRLNESTRYWIQRGSLLLVVTLGVMHVWSFAWLGDDAFISFRYSQNFAEGHGLVFNHGEWVEGYTNFLWTFILGVLHYLGFSIPHTALVLNITSFVGVLIVAHLIITRWLNTPMMWPSWTSVLLAGCSPFAIYGTSGLETMSGALCVIGGVAMTLKGRYRIGGLFFVLGAMMRPDHILFWGCMGLALAFDDLVSSSGHLFKRLDWRRYFYFTLPLVLVYVPFFAFRWWLYGDMFPNTYYAKSGNLTYFSQGVRYLGVFLGTTGGYVWLPLWLLALVFGSKDRRGIVLRVFSVLSVLIFGTYVCKVGGGFMENRFLLVLLPIVFLTIEVWARPLLMSEPRRLLLLGSIALLFTAVLTRVEVIKPFQKKWHIAAEHTWYQVSKLYPLEIRSRYFGIGKKLGKMFEDHPYKPRIAYPCVGMVGYYSRLPLVDTYGLVNRRVAHKELHKRGRPGHEKNASLEDVIAEKAVLAHDRYAPRALKKYLEVRMAGTSLYLLENREKLQSKLKGVKGIAWPQSVTRQMTKAAREGDRTKLLELKALGARLIDESMQEKLDSALKSIDDFEVNFADWEISKGKPFRNAANLIGRTGRYSAELPSKKAVMMQRVVRLDQDEVVKGVIAGGGSDGQRLELRQGDNIVDVHQSSGRPYFEPFLLDPKMSGIYELHVLSDGKGSPLLLDGLFKASRVQAPLMNANATAFDINLWHRGLKEMGPENRTMQVYAERFIGTRWSFDDEQYPEGTKRTGKAFGAKPVLKGIARQSKLRGKAYGGIINSFQGGDKSIGKISLPPFTVDGNAIHVSVAGGAKCQKLYVGLVVEGKTHGRVCGRNDEKFRTRRISTKRFIGKTAHLVIVDNSTTRWGHIMVDEVIIPKATTAIPR